MADGAMAWEEEVDVLVVGSGAGALLAACVAAEAGGRVLVVEKCAEFGGTSATSGGGIWIPNSHLGREAGLADSPEEAFRYIRALTAPNISDEHVRAFVTSAPDMLRWLVEKTPVRYASLPYPDYHVELPGGKPGYRTHLPLELDGRKLGDEMLAMRAASPAASLFGRINWKFTETYALLFRPKGWIGIAARMLLRYALDLRQRLRSPKDRFLTLGTSLVGGLRMALAERGVPLWRESPLLALVRDEQGVVGAVVKREGREMRIRARGGVILGAGGFERNEPMRRAHLPKQPVATLSGGQEGNAGDAITMAVAVGAAVKNMHSAWWATVFAVPGEPRGRLSSVERALPGCVILDQDGQRYLNEAASYEMVAKQMLAAAAAGRRTQPSWFVFDASFRAKYPAGPLMPLIPDWLHPRAVRKILKKGRTPEELAVAAGLPPAALAATLARFNTHAARGEDPDFHRGEAAYDRMYGDARVQPNPTLAPIARAPFYALPIWAGDIGTNGGLDTDCDARVLDQAGTAIAGLYAVGNTAASVMGESYPGAGATLGPAMTFGYVAARHAMALQSRDQAKKAA